MRRLDYIVNVEMEMTAREEEGKAEERRNFADKLINLGMDDEFIVKTTGLDLETIVRLRSEVSQH